MKTVEDFVKYMYTEMVAADKKAWELMGKVAFNEATEEEDKEFTHLSERAMTIEDLLLSMIDRDKMTELLETGMKKPEVHTYTDCFLFQKSADVTDDGLFKGWVGKLYLYTKSHEMPADEFWNLYKEYL